MNTAHHTFIALLVTVFTSSLFAQSHTISNEQDLRDAIVSGGSYVLENDITLTESLPVFENGEFFALEGLKERDVLGVNKYRIDFNGFSGFNYPDTTSLDVDSLLFKSLIFENAFRDSSGGAIRVGGYSYRYDVADSLYLHINDVMFQNNKTESNGGALYFNTHGANLVIENSYFGNNQAGRDEAWCDTYVEQAFNDSADFDKNDEKAVQNLSFCNGGALLIYSGVGVTVTIDNSTFYQNRAYGAGGAVFLGGAENTDLQFDHISVVENSSSYGGGGIYNHQRIQLSNSIVYNNILRGDTAANGADIAGSADGASVIEKSIVSNMFFFDYPADSYKPNQSIKIGGSNKYSVKSPVTDSPELDTLTFLEGTYVIPFKNQRQTSLKPSGINGTEVETHSEAFDQRFGVTDFVENGTDTPLPHYRSEHGASATDVGAYEYVNHKPYDLVFEGGFIPEDATGDVYVGDFSVSDQDTFDVHNYTLISGAGFEVRKDTLFYDGSLSLREDDEHMVGIRSCDDAWISLCFDTIVTVTITEANKKPYDLALSDDWVYEMAPKGTVVGKLTVKDPNTWDKHTFTISDDTYNAFGIDSDGITIIVQSNISLVFEERGSIEIEVTVTDIAGLSVKESFEITIKKAAPYDLALSDNWVKERASKGTTVGTLSVKDPNSGDSHTFTLTEDPYGAFELDSDGRTLIVKSNSSFVYEERRSVALEVTATDIAGLSVVETFTVFIENVNRAPTDIYPRRATVVESAKKGSLLLELEATDSDEGDTFEWRIVEESPFSFDGNQLVVDDEIRYKDEPLYALLVEVNDGNGGRYSDTVYVEVLKVDSDMEIFLETSYLHMTRDYLEGVEAVDSIVQVVYENRSGNKDDLEGYTIAIEALLPLSDYDLKGEANKGWERTLHYEIKLFDNLGQYVDGFKGGSDINEEEGIREDGTISAAVVIAPKDIRGMQTQDGRLWGDGLYIVQIQVLLVARPTKRLQEEYGFTPVIHQNSFTARFGYMRDK